MACGAGCLKQNAYGGQEAMPSIDQTDGERWTKPTKHGTWRAYICLGRRYLDVGELLTLKERNAFTDGTYLP